MRSTLDNKDTIVLYKEVKAKKYGIKVKADKRQFAKSLNHIKIKHGQRSLKSSDACI